MEPERRVVVIEREEAEYAALLREVEDVEAHADLFMKSLMNHRLAVSRKDEVLERASMTLLRLARGKICAKVNAHASNRCEHCVIVDAATKIAQAKAIQPNKLSKLSDAVVRAVEAAKTGDDVEVCWAIGGLVQAVDVGKKK